MKFPNIFKPKDKEKRSILLTDNDGNPLTYAEWASMYDSTNADQKSPTMESVYDTIAREFAKIDLKHVVIKNGEYENKNSNLNYLVSERPNKLQSKYDFLYTMAYQESKYGNAVAYLYRDEDGQVTSIEPINVNDYSFGKGYVINGQDILFKFRNNSTNTIELVDYQNVIHLRSNPNDIFYGDTFTGLNNSGVLVNLVDSALTSLIKELRENGTVRGIISIGGATTGYARGVATRVLAGTEEKINKQQEIVDRIKKTKGGILVLDAGEEWKSIGNPFSTTSTSDIKKYMDLLYQFNGINGAVVDGTATSDQMEVFFQKTIRPRIEQLVSEMNYKIFSKRAIANGNRIEYYRNPFEYLPLDRTIDSIYKAKGDITTNEVRTMVYKFPPIKGGDELMYNKNFDFANGNGANTETNTEGEDTNDEEN